MIELLPLSIGIGLGVSLLFTEVFGVAAGGMVVPGYFALNFSRPEDIAATLLVGLLTYVVVHGLSSVMVIYGRRRTALMILFGYLLGAGLRWASGGMVFGAETDFVVIGFIIPGLIAIWFDRQGVLTTMSSLVTASVVVRLIRILVVGNEVLQ